MPDFHVDMQQHQLTNQPDLTFDNPKSEPDQEPSFATNVNQPQFTFDEPKSEPDTDDGLPAFTTNVCQPQFTFDQEPKSEPDTEHGLPSNAANVTQLQFTLNQQSETEPVGEHPQHPHFIDLNDEPKSEPDQEPQFATNVNIPQITLHPPEVNQQPAPTSPIVNSGSLRPEPARDPAPRLRPKIISPFTSRAERARRKAATDVKAAADSTMTQNTPKQPVPANNSNNSTLDPSAAANNVSSHSPKQPMPANNSMGDPLLTVLAAADHVPPHSPEPPVTTSKSIRETLSTLAAAHNVPLHSPEGTAPTQKSMHDTLSEYYAAGKAKPYSSNATGAVPKPSVATSKPTPTISAPKTNRPPRSFQEINADTSIFSAPARTYTHVGSDPPSLISFHYHHLGNLARRLRDKEAEACDREEHLAAMLEHAQMLRKIAVQERSDGLVLIRHRHRELAALEGKTKEEIENNPEWRDKLWPLKLGEVKPGSAEFEAMAKEARRRERLGENDEYDSD